MARNGRQRQINVVVAQHQCAHCRQRVEAAILHLPFERGLDLGGHPRVARLLVEEISHALTPQCCTRKRGILRAPDVCGTVGAKDMVPFFHWVTLERCLAGDVSKNWQI
jgi:hypothetical protein